MKNDSMVMFWYKHMRELVKQLYPWYNIDKIKPWACMYGPRIVWVNMMEKMFLIFTLMKLRCTTKNTLFLMKRGQLSERFRVG